MVRMVVDVADFIKLLRSVRDTTKCNLTGDISTVSVDSNVLLVLTIGPAVAIHILHVSPYRAISIDTYYDLFAQSRLKATNVLLSNTTSLSLCYCPFHHPCVLYLILFDILR